MLARSQRIQTMAHGIVSVTKVATTCKSTDKTALRWRKTWILGWLFRTQCWLLLRTILILTVNTDKHPKFKVCLRQVPILPHICPCNSFIVHDLSERLTDWQMRGQVYHYQNRGYQGHCCMHCRLAQTTHCSTLNTKGSWSGSSSTKWQQSLCSVECFWVERGQILIGFVPFSARTLGFAGLSRKS